MDSRDSPTAKRDSSVTTSWQFTQGDFRVRPSRILPCASASDSSAELLWGIEDAWTSWTQPLIGRTRLPPNLPGRRIPEGRGNQRTTRRSIRQHVQHHNAQNASGCDRRPSDDERRKRCRLRGEWCLPSDRSNLGVRLPVTKQCRASGNERAEGQQQEQQPERPYSPRIPRDNSMRRMRQTVLRRVACSHKHGREEQYGGEKEEGLVGSRQPHLR